MEIFIRCTPWRKILTSLMLGLVLALVAVPVVEADVCDRNPDHPKCDGDGDSEGEFELTITYHFGHPNINGDPVSSTVSAIGTKRCDVKGGCSFKGDIQGDPVAFKLPQSLMDLLDITSWKGMEEGETLDPYACFPGAPPQADSTGRSVELAHGADGTWFAAIGSYAKDTAGMVDRKYVFYFLCDGFCNGSQWAESSMEGVYHGGELLRIEADAKDRGGKSIPCRCTISSIPNCPGDIDIPMMISVTETQLP